MNSYTNQNNSENGQKDKSVDKRKFEHPTFLEEVKLPRKPGTTFKEYIEEKEVYT